MSKFIIAAQVPKARSAQHRCWVTKRICDYIKMTRLFLTRGINDLVVSPLFFLPWAPKTMKSKGLGHIKTRLFTTKTSKNVGVGGPGCIFI